MFYTQIESFSMSTDVAREACGDALMPGRMCIVDCELFPFQIRHWSFTRPVSSVSESAMTTHWGTLLKLFNHTTILANALNECEEGRREKIEQLRLAGLAG